MYNGNVLKQDLYHTKFGLIMKKKKDVVQKQIIFVDDKRRALTRMLS